jgi:hypothetical protein
MLELRPAQLSEYAEVAQLHAASWKKTYRGIMSDQFLNDDVERVLYRSGRTDLAPRFQSSDHTCGTGKHYCWFFLYLPGR